MRGVDIATRGRVSNGLGASTLGFVSQVFEVAATAGGYVLQVYQHLVSSSVRFTVSVTKWEEIQVKFTIILKELRESTLGIWLAQASERLTEIVSTLILPLSESRKLLGRIPQSHFVKTISTDKDLTVQEPSTSICSDSFSIGE